MSIFSSYDNLNTDYIPNNTIKEKVYELEKVQNTPPYSIFNILKKYKGISWYYGDAFSLKIDVGKIISVPQNSIVYSEAGQMPLESTEGSKGQQAYNVIDNLSWTCDGVSSGIYIWTLNTTMYESTNDSKFISLAAPSSATFEVVISNFRGESIYTHTYDASVDNSVTLDIDTELSSKMMSGTYSITVIQKSAEDVSTIREISATVK